MSSLSMLHGLSPFGPIFGKELRTTSRRKRTYVLRVGYLGFLLLFMLLTYVSTSRFGSYGGGVAWQMQQQAQMGMMFFFCFTMFSVCAMSLIGPVLTATALSGERLHKTMSVLLMTPITSWQIVGGKLMSRLLGALTLIGLTLPVLALVRLLGGVTPEQMTGTICLSASAALIGASVGLLLSALMNRAYAVILLGYAATLLLQLFVPFVFISLFMDQTNNVPSIAFPAMFSPVMVAGFLGAGQLQMSRMLSAWWMPGWMPLWGPCVIMQCVLSAGLLVLTSSILRKQARGEGDRAKTPFRPTPPPVPVTPPPLPVAPVDASGSSFLESDVPVPPVVVPEVRKTSKEREVGDNPVLWYELRRPLMPSKAQRTVGMLAAVVVLLISYAALGWRELGRSDTQIGFAFVFHFLGTLLVCVVSATAIAQEKESDTWTLLLTTPLSGNQVVWGKAMGLCKRVMWPAVFVMVHFTLFTIFQVISIGSWLLVAWVLLTFNLIWLATGIYLSLRIRKTTFAVILNLMLPLCAYLVTFLVFATIGLALRDGGQDWTRWIALYLPYFYLASGIDRFNGNGMSWLPYAGQVSHATFGMVTFAMGVVHVMLAWLILSRAGERFDKIVGRAPSERTKCGRKAFGSLQA